ncbi:MAG: IS200/IS605 family transposase [Bacteroidales bacterium]|nr:MAG: IS200/IS605 family transposase [Bacteroidales bacterium]
MPQSLSKVYVHIIFSTKNRQNLINDNIENSLYEYLGGICKGLECNPVKVGGHKNHIHVLCLLSRKVAQMKLLEEIKKQSSKWIKTKGPAYSNFYWQDGYGIFSINPTQTDEVIDYIQLQHEHHKHKSFQDEFRAFLKKYKLEYDERYVWD